MGGRRQDAVDALVGQNIRILRQDRGMSQTELGRKIDVTFQQVQKYENGTNRVGSGRLFKIASTLGVPITALFEGAHEAVNGDSRPSPVAMLAEPYVLRLLQAFCAVENMDLRRSLAELAEQMAADRAPAPRG
jgi:transcriptional regulator with XRE-family HTH domain